MISNGESLKIQAYLQQKFGNGALTVKARSQATDSVEVLLNGEFIGLVYKDDEEGDVSYDFNMAILELDLPA
jgi:hypothetical protein